ncbi:MAG TPA: mechanosensitive ion channel domain-containing protein [Steroidobacteraceae bacterium]|nr:mechanosensitive ion channel domain-containing protein [Steroidobacteraceae bacterium]
MRGPFLMLMLAAVGAGGWARAADASRVSVLTAKQVIQILDDTVDWYRTLGTQQQNAKEPSDLLILYANRQTADQVVGLAFEIARANAELLSSEANAGQSAADQSSPLALNQRQSRLDEQSKAIQKEMAAARRRSAAKLPLLQDQLAMVNAHKNLLDTMAAFVNQSNPKGADANALKAHIDAIAATVPTAGSVPAAGKPGTPSAMDMETTAPERYGLWDLGSNAVKLRNKMKTIEAIDQRTTALAAMFKEISAPPLNQLHAYSARSDALASQAGSTAGAELAALRGEFDTLAWLFKQTSDILLPLSKEQVLLQQYRHNLSNWLETTQREYHDALAALAVRLAVLAGILAGVFLLAEIWRRAVLRYSHDLRRRSQLLLIRKIVTWVAVICIIGVSFATEISTFATFAGLLTAGVAVAMQSVLVSVVGYFFLIGKYGIRVGDRIQIGTVVGEVIDIGLVRMHLMELNAGGPLGPTGRVVAFANLVVFQASGGLFKQIPGVSISWHETKLNLPVVKDYAALKDKLLAAVGEVAARYRDEIVRQSKEIQRSTASSSVNDTAPQVRMHLTDGRMEALIRYPVHVEHAAEIDEEVSEAVLGVIAEHAPPGP